MQDAERLEARSSKVARPSRSVRSIPDRDGLATIALLCHMYYGKHTPICQLIPYFSTALWLNNPILKIVQIYIPYGFINCDFLNGCNCRAKSLFAHVGLVSA